jgi:hypothetical protein
MNESSFLTYGYWPIAITGAQIYLGNLLDLLTGKPDMYFVYYSNPNNYTILLISGENNTDPNAFYNPDFIERQIINRIYENVFVVRKIATEEIQYWNSTWYTFIRGERDILSFLSIGWIDDNFTSGWENPYDFSTDGDVMSLTASFTPNVINNISVFKAVSLSTNDYPYLLIRVKTDGGVNTPWMAIRIWYADGFPDVLEYYPKDNNWHLKSLRMMSDKKISRIGIAFTNYGIHVPEGTYYAYIDFVAFTKW